jgi:ribosomal protein S18 acetylase RimI-like enzyme
VPELRVEPLEGEHRAWATQVVTELWRAPVVVSRGRVHRPGELPGFVALLDDRRVGLVTYEVEDGSCELVTIDSLVEGRGVGTALVDAVRDVAHAGGCRRLWLITTNDNLHALRFYQRRGFLLAALHRDAIEASRRLKPELPELGNDGIPIRDELELELLL